MDTGSAPRPEDDPAGDILRMVRDMLADLHQNHALPLEVGLDSRLDRDLALDSLSRAALLSQIEARFGLSLPDQALAQAETPRDLLRFVLESKGRGAEPGNPAPAAPNPGAAAQKGLVSLSILPNERMGPLFEAVVGATEEAIVNALVAGRTTTGNKGTTVRGLPLDQVKAILARHGLLGTPAR